MKFFKYPSLENHYREKFTDKIKFSPQAQAEWVATEKLHGASYQICWDSETGEIKSGKRSGFIEDENFFNHEQADRVAYPKIKQVDTGDAYYIFYGELCGGNLQKNVDYSDDQKFVCFDIAVISNDEPDELFFISYEDMRQVCDDIGLERVPEIARGTFSELLEMENTFNSWYGDFTAEGFVMKPVQNAWMPNGSRMIIKSKTPKFSEKSGKKRKAPPKALSENEVKYIEGVSEYINDNRLNNVLSKVGEADPSKTFMVMGMLVQDAIEDFDKDNESNFKDLDKPERKRINKSLQDIARPLVAPKL